MTDIQAQINMQQNTALVQSVLDRLEFRSGDGQPWEFSIVAGGGWWRQLRIRVDVPDSDVPPGAGMVVRTLIDHYLGIPYSPLLGPEDAERWVLNQILLVQRHEACENFWIDGRRPFEPEHGPGSDPYRLRRVS